MAVARPSSDGVATRSDCVHVLNGFTGNVMFAHNDTKKMYIQSDSTRGNKDLTRGPRRILKLTHQGATPDRDGIGGSRIFRGGGFGNPSERALKDLARGGAQKDSN